MSHISDKFFAYKHEVKVGDNTHISLNTVALDSIERSFTEPDGKLSIVLKSMTDGYRSTYIQEGKKIVEKSVKVPVNVVIEIDNQEDVKRFNELMGHVTPVTEKQSD